MKTRLTIFLAVLSLAGPLAAAGPQLLVREAGGREAPLNIAEIAIEVTIAGDVAETTILVGFKNDTTRRLEGDFVMPLPDGATVSSYALDVNGAMREGVSVEKERARFAYESIKARRVDPGFVEREANNVYRTRIFPILPRTVKRVRLGYVEHLKIVDGKLRYTLPCRFKGPVANFTCNIRGTGGTKVELGESLNLPFAVSPTGDLSVKTANREIEGVLALHISPPKAPTLLIETSPGDNRPFFYLTDVAPEQAPVPARRQPAGILLVWDASESRQSRPAELAALDAFFQHIDNTRVRLQLLRHTTTEAGQFTVRNGDWSKLRAALEEVYYDGSTALDQLHLNNHAEDIMILCTDGVSPFGLPSGTAKKPVFLLNGSGKPTPPAWTRLAHLSGGASLDLSRINPAQAVDLLTRHHLRILSVRGAGTYACHFDPNVTPGQAVRVSGRLRANASGMFKVSYGYGKTVVTTRSFTIGSGQPAEGGIVRRLWAQAALIDLESAARSNEARIIAHCQQYGLVSDYTSLIVLELFSDHVRYEIPPPEPHLKTRYDAAIADKRAGNSSGVERLSYQWYQKRTWHRSEFPWMEIALLPRLEQVSIWTKAVSTVFREEDLDQESFKVIDDLRREAIRLVRQKKQLATGAELAAWKKEIEKLVRSGGTLRQTPITPPKPNGPLVVSVRGLVNQPGTISGKAGLTLKQAIAKAGGIFTLGSKTNVELYRNAGKTVYNMASNQFKDVALMPGDMVVVGEEYLPASEWGDIDPFAAHTDREPWDPSKQPAVVEDSDVWISGGGDIDPFGSGEGGGGSPAFLTDISDDSTPAVELAGTVTITQPARDEAPAFTAFEEALKKPGDPERAYRTLRKSGRHPVAFYVESARLLTRHGHRDLAAQALSNLLELPEFDLSHVLAAAMWLTEFDHIDSAIALLEHVHQRQPDEQLSRYQHAMLEVERKDTIPASMLYDFFIKNSEPNRAIVALTDFNALVARKELPANPDIPVSMRDNFDADIRIVVTGSDPESRASLTVGEPLGHTCFDESPCGGRIVSDNGVSEYMLRRAMPGHYTVSCRSRHPMTVRAILYRNWGRPNQTRRTVTVLLKGDRKSATIAEYDFEFGE